MSRRPVRLVWKLEQGTESEGRDGADAGPAWLDTLGADGRVVASERVESGDWITRDHARRLAEAHGYELVEDDGRTTTSESARGVSDVDVAAINEQLRSAGITEAELLVTRHSLGRNKGWFLGLGGSLTERDMPPGLRSPPDELEGLVLHSMRLPADAAELFDLLDEFAPDWRGKDDPAG